MRPAAGRAGNPERAAAPGRDYSRLLDRFGTRPVELVAHMMIAHDARGEGLEFDEIVGLAPQIIRNHRRRGADRRNDRYAHPLALHCFDESSEITISGE